MDILLTFLTSTLTGLITYFFGRKKAKADIENSILNNLEKSIGIYQVIIDDMRGQIKELNGKICELEAKVDELLVENQNLKYMLKEKDEKLN